MEFTTKLEDLYFADDLVLLSSEFHMTFNKRHKNSMKLQDSHSGLRPNKDITKVMRLNTDETEAVKVNGEDLEGVETFTNLGA